MNTTNVNVCVCVSKFKQLGGGIAKSRSNSRSTSRHALKGRVQLSTLLVKSTFTISFCTQWRQWLTQEQAATEGRHYRKLKPKNISQEYPLQEREDTAEFSGQWRETEDLKREVLTDPLLKQGKTGEQAVWGTHGKHTADNQTFTSSNMFKCHSSFLEIFQSTSHRRFATEALQSSVLESFQSTMPPEEDQTLTLPPSSQQEGQKQVGWWQRLKQDNTSAV